MKGKYFECGICKNTIKDRVGSIINLGEGNLIVRCKTCTKLTVPLSNLHEVSIVPVSRTTMDFILRNKKYYHPMAYKRRSGKYLAFYVQSPVSAVTHYGAVKQILKDIPIEHLIDTSQFNVFVGDKGRYKVYEFDKIIPLMQPIKKGNRGAVQNTKHTTLSNLLKAKELNDL